MDAAIGGIYDATPIHHIHHIELLVLSLDLAMSSFHPPPIAMEPCVALIYQYDQGLEFTQVREFIRLFPNVRDFVVGDNDPTFFGTLCETQTANGLLWPQLYAITLAPSDERHGFKFKKLVH